jgi:hypothetical protein
MVNGCRLLAERHDLYFITITCKGKEISHEYAEENYGKWTNRFLDACRARWTRAGREWHYVQVTERQARQHPHSHILTTFNPDDLVPGCVRKYERTANGGTRGYWKDALRSHWLECTLGSSGLGEQYDISRVETAEGASRYVAKYLFKSSIFVAGWPARWKRIRYSQGFPQAQERETNAIVLLTQGDWYHLAERAVVVTVGTLDDFQEASDRLHFHDTIVRLKTSTKA